MSRPVISATGLYTPPHAISNAELVAEGRIEDLLSSAVTGFRLRCAAPAAAQPVHAGALLVPPAIARKAAKSALPAGLALYSGQSEWSGRLAPAAAGLPDTHNPGILARQAFLHGLYIV